MAEVGPRDAVRRLGDVAIPDPYQWLEADSDEVARWSAEHDGRSRAWLAEHGADAALARRLHPHLEAQHVRPPRRLGDQWLCAQRVDGRSVLDVAACPDGVGGTLLFDPVDAGAVDVEGFWPAPDGRAVVVAVRVVVGGAIMLRVLGVDGTVGPPMGPTVHLPRIAWDPGSSVFYFAAPTEDGADPPQLFRAGLDGERPRRLGTVTHLSSMLHPQLSPDGRWLLAVSGYTAPCPHSILDTRGDGAWIPFLPQDGRYFNGSLLDDAFIAATDDGADRGRVVSIPLSAPRDRDRWRELLPESEVVTRAAQVIGGHVVVSGIVDGASRLRVIHRESGSWWTVPGEPRAAVGTDARSWSHMPIEEPGFVVDGTTITYLSSAHARSPQTLRLRPDDPHAVPEVLRPAEFDHPDLSVSRRDCPSRDGTRIPLWVVQRRDLGAEAALPTLVYGYGGWNNAFLPVYLGGFLPFLQAGGRVVLPNLHGGGELGRQWWQGGRGKVKARTVDDLVDVLDWVRGTRLAPPGGLGILGASLGGMNVLSVLVRRPELVDAVAALVPVTDLVHDTTFPDGYGPIGEYGDPADPGFAGWMLSYSPYHNVEPAPYPPTLLACAAEDTACPPLESRKMVARLEAATTGSAPILYRCWPDSDHIAGELGTAEQTAEWLAFLATHLGVDLQED